MTLEFGFPPYPKLCDFTLWQRNGNCSVSVVWKITTCWLFGSYPSVPIMVAGLPLSADSYMAYREWGFLMPMSACTNREGWRETASLSTANSCLLPAYSQHIIPPFLHNLANVWGSHISSSEYLYKFHMFCTSQPAKIWLHTSVQIWSTLFNFQPFWIASKQILL